MESNKISISLRVDAADGGAMIDLELDNLIIAGWTGRDRAALEAHIKELQELGVTPPTKTPIFYPVSTQLLTTGDVIQVVGDGASGEVEAVFLTSPQGSWIGLGSDHTDRQVEVHNVNWSKQICPKPISGTVWPFDEVAGHWDDLLVKSHVYDGAERQLYQEGPLAKMLHPHTLLEKLAGEMPIAGKTIAMFCGTLPALLPIGQFDRFDMTLTDPVLGREIQHNYVADCLPDAG